MGRIELNWTLFEDNEITETDTDDVLDYTKLETPTKLYDYIKKFWVDSLGSYGGNDLYATKSGETLNFGSWDLFMAADHSNTVQYELGDAIHQGGSIWQSTGDISGPFDQNDWSEVARGVPFARYQNKLFVYYGNSFTGHVQSTGRVRIKHFEHVDGSIIDSAFNSTFLFDGIDSWKLYDTVADRRSESNLVAEGSVSDAHRFTFTSGKVYYFVLQAGGESILKNVEPDEKGITEVNLSTVTLLNAALRKIEEVRVVVDDLDELIEDDGLGDVRFTAAAIPAGRIASAVWGANTNSHAGASTFATEIKKVFSATAGPFTHQFFDSDGTTEVFTEGDAYQVKFYNSEGSRVATFAKQTSDTDTTRVLIQEAGKLIRL